MKSQIHAMFHWHLQYRASSSKPNKYFSLSLPELLLENCSPIEYKLIFFTILFLKVFFFCIFVFILYIFCVFVCIYVYDIYSLFCFGMDSSISSYCFQSKPFWSCIETFLFKVSPPIFAMYSFHVKSGGIIMYTYSVYCIK